MNAPNQALGAPVPFAKLNGVGKVAADYSCLGNRLKSLKTKQDFLFVKSDFQTACFPTGMEAV